MKFYYLVRVLSESPKVAYAENADRALALAEMAYDRFNAHVKVYRMKWDTYMSTGGVWDVPTFVQFADVYAEYEV